MNSNNLELSLPEGGKVFDGMCHAPSIFKFLEPNTQLPVLRKFLNVLAFYNDDPSNPLASTELGKAKSELLSVNVDFSDVPLTEANQQAISTFLAGCFFI